MGSGPPFTTEINGIGTYLVILGGIGGYMGLFVGASVVSIIEILVSMVMVAAAFLGVKLNWLW